MLVGQDEKFGELRRERDLNQRSTELRYPQFRVLNEFVDCNRTIRD